MEGVHFKTLAQHKPTLNPIFFGDVGPEALEGTPKTSRRGSITPIMKNTT